MKLTGEIKIILGSVLFALIPICVKLDPNNSVYSLLFGRLFFASLLLFLLKRSFSYYFKISLKNFLLLFVWAAIMFGAMVFYFIAIKVGGVAISSALLGTQPLLIILLALLFLKEKLSAQSILACVLTLVGVFLLFDFSEVTLATNKGGQFLALSSAALLSLNFVFHKKYLSHIPSDKLVFYQSLFQLPFLIPFLIVDPPQLSGSFLFAGILLGVFCTVSAYGLIYSGANSVSAQKIGVLQSIEYIMPMAFGVLFYQEILKFEDLIGAIFIIASTILISIKPVLKKGQSI